MSYPLWVDICDEREYTMQGGRKEGFPPLTEEKEKTLLQGSVPLQSSMDKRSSALVRALRGLVATLDPSHAHLGEGISLVTENGLHTNADIASFISGVVDAYEVSFPFIVPKLSSPEGELPVG